MTTKKAVTTKETMRHLLAQLEAMRNELAWLRQRVAAFHPERSYCPECHALVSLHADKCHACSLRLRSRRDTKAGLPR